MLSSTTCSGNLGEMCIPIYLLEELSPLTSSPPSLTRTLSFCFSTVGILLLSLSLSLSLSLYSRSILEGNGFAMSRYIGDQLAAKVSRPSEFPEWANISNT